MKKLILLSVVGLTCFTALGQSTTFKGRIIPEKEVPSEVLNSQLSNFKDVKVIRWKRQQSTGRKGNSIIRYVSFMREGKRPLSNARYSAEGEILFYSEYYSPRTIPNLLGPDLAKNFPDQRITGGVRIKLFKTEKEYYRVRLKKGSTVTYVFYDKEGNQVDRNKLPKDIDFR